MHNFKVDDIVKVVKQPANQCVQLVGEIAFITEIEGINEGFVNIQTLTSGGFGPVGASCLEHYNDEIWRHRKREYDEKHAREMVVLQRYSDDKTAQLNVIYATLSVKYNLPVDSVKDLIRDYEKLTY